MMAKGYGFKSPISPVRTAFRTAGVGAKYKKLAVNTPSFGAIVFAMRIASGDTDKAEDDLLEVVSCLGSVVDIVGSLGRRQSSEDEVAFQWTTPGALDGT
jgi:hypothetical protein